MIPPLDDVEARFFTTCLADDRHPVVTCAVCSREIRRTEAHVQTGIQSCSCTAEELRAWLDAQPKSEPRQAGKKAPHYRLCSHERARQARRDAADRRDLLERLTPKHDSGPPARTDIASIPEEQREVLTPEGRAPVDAHSYRAFEYDTVQRPIRGHFSIGSDGQITYCGPPLTATVAPCRHTAVFQCVYCKAVDCADSKCGARSLVVDWDEVVLKTLGYVCPDCCAEPCAHRGVWFCSRCYAYTCMCCLQSGVQIDCSITRVEPEHWRDGTLVPFDCTSCRETLKETP